MGLDPGLCRDLQFVHDSLPRGSWKDGFAWVAKKHDLVYVPESPKQSL